MVWKPEKYDSCYEKQGLGWFVFFFIIFLFVLMGFLGMKAESQVAYGNLIYEKCVD